jgi:hypothetical protein
MLKKLKRELYYFENGVKYLGNGTNIIGDCSYLMGNLDECCTPARDSLIQIGDLTDGTSMQ